MNKVFLLILFVLSSFTSVFAEGAAEEPTNYMAYEGSHKDVWKLEATDPLLIGGYGDNFVYDGKNVVPLEGKATVEVNAKKNTGKMIVEFKGTINPEAGVSHTGDIRIEYTEFDEGSEFWEGGIADFVYIHGDTGQEAPVMPKVKSDLASWGPADVYVNDELVYEALVGHMMYTEASRNKKDYAIYNADKSAYYSPMKPADGSIAHPDEMELHFVAHTVEPDTGNFPPHTVWIHLNFITVKDM
ncbi:MULTISPECIES: hypothetical protein [unclassified Oceanispirochaeta]|uniref:hypothetical protein n=1 Tax=unclassified Oceanispirochaeta TaxID=2635722 RepID=UPI000E08E11C|nr:MULTISPECIES: hypothetical protein [unclassified Oceanispirochaeta]MBF9016908.1 hypothetical protein [Oceanispirochaeta sp. M2]NPD73271.1 hypothetical protein [Oceanispirochaeta sp. M1]RDG31137.1 hypothetical protein DV872_14315 [Oceanispirochaeta sp. M1]